MKFEQRPMIFDVKIRQIKNEWCHTVCRVLTFYAVIFICLIINPLDSISESDVKKAVNLFRLQRYEEVIIILEELLKTYNNNSTAHYYLGKTYLKLKNYDKAVKHCERAVTIQSNQAEHHFCLGLSYGKKATQASLWQKAFLARKIRNAFQKTVELDPKHIGGRIGLTQFYLRAPAIIGGNIDKADEQAKILVMLDSTTGKALLEKIRNRKEESATREEQHREVGSDP